MRTKQKPYHAPEAVDSSAPDRTTISVLFATKRVFLIFNNCPLSDSNPRPRPSDHRFAHSLLRVVVPSLQKNRSELNGDAGRVRGR
uniref:Uncharacterized protein n=1 Tax=Noccaea caerulescens TaxID=107243 RepID=A0A1J3H4M7_NOCCA